MKKIEPEIDRYGNLARASFFADYIEVLTLGGHRSSKSLLQDMIEDAFANKREILSTIPGDGNEEEWTPGLYAPAAWSCLEQRSDLLDDLYPFVVTSNRLKLKQDVDVHTSPYIALLAISLAHAFGASASLSVETVFEDLVADAMEEIGLRVGRVGALSRQPPGGFSNTLERLGVALDMATYPDAIVHRLNANDAKVDVIGLLDWRDNRRGRWMFLGQVTCAKSDEWHSKIFDPVPSDWMKYLGETTPPVPFLALPYHVEDSAISFMAGIERSIVDRPQLALNLKTISPEVSQIIDVVLSAEIQTFAVQ
ncbi:hypothetical protein [Pseudarthrobacter enclensis]|uniref:hypothetical protein n=1 Tax=Pseudarthrobacter enclensis TaxID=993070 RepID=UPI003EE0A7F5